MIYLGKLLQENDLNIFFYANKEIASGDKDILNVQIGVLNDIEFTLNQYQSTSESALVLVDPYYVSYTIYDCTQGLQEIIRQTINTKPLRHDTGVYYAGIKLHPRIFRVGRHIIQWSYKRFPESNLRKESISFDIIRTAHYSGEFCKSQYSTDKCII